MEPTRAAGLERLRQFLPAAGKRYTSRRNYDLGPDNRGNVSMLSPWLRRRLLLEAEVVVAAASAHGPAGAEKFIDEIFWRAYFRGWLAHRPAVWAAYQDELHRCRRQLDKDPELARRLTAAEAGQTGNAAFDYWARELRTTNYLHNHARMWFASIWVFTLRLPWVLGADFFLRHLLDGDPASNTLSWRWVSGLHTRGKTYLARRDNVLKFTDGRLDPGPELATTADIPADNSPVEPAALVLPEPAAEPATDSAWLLTEDDLSLPGDWPEQLPVFAINCLAELSPGGVAPAVKAFCEGAMEGVLQTRAPAVAPLVAPVTATSLLEQLDGSGIRRLHHFYLPYGPAAATLARLEPQLRERGITLQPQVRGYDRRAWPHSNRGFFKLKKRIPSLLKALSERPDPC